MHCWRKCENCHNTQSTVNLAAHVHQELLECCNRYVCVFPVAGGEDDDDDKPLIL